MNLYLTWKRLIIAAIALLPALLPWPPAWAAGSESNPVVIHFFWGEGCPHCELERAFLENLQRQHPQVELIDYEVWNHPENKARLLTIANAYGTKVVGVPATFIGDRVWVGFTERYKGEMDDKVRSCIESGCPDPGQRLLAAKTGEIGPSEETPLTAPPPEEGHPIDREAASAAQDTITIPFFGEIDLASQSLVVTTSLIAFVDGFNPCSLWVLSMLLAIVIHSGSRERVFAVGLTFLLVTASVYGLFIAGLFNVFAYVGYLDWIQVAVALLALTFALVNIKDYFWYKQGISFTIPDKYKPKIYRDIRQIIASKSLLAMIGATAAMALGITLVELPCTAGFPVIWSNIVAEYHLNLFSFALLLGLYLVIYLLDELIVFFSVVFTLKASKFEEKHGRMLKLIGGMIMLALAIVLLVDPELMNDLGGSLVIFGAALLASLLVMLVHRRVLPRFGLHLGTEERRSEKRGSG